MELDCRSFFFYFTLGVLKAILTSATLTTVPLNTVALLDQPITLNCTSNVSANALLWQFQPVGNPTRQPVGNCFSGVAATPPYVLEAPTVYSCNVVIERVTPAHAGQYLCTNIGEDSGTVSGILAVVETTPLCARNSTRPIDDDAVAMTASIGCYDCESFTPNIAWLPSDGNPSPMVTNRTYVSDMYTVEAEEPSLPETTAMLEFTQLSFTSVAGQATNVPTDVIRLCTFIELDVEPGPTKYPTSTTTTAHDTPTTTTVDIANSPTTSIANVTATTTTTIPSNATTSDSPNASATTTASIHNNASATPNVTATTTSIPSNTTPSPNTTATTTPSNSNATPSPTAAATTTPSNSNATPSTNTTATTPVDANLPTVTTSAVSSATTTTAARPADIAPPNGAARENLSAGRIMMTAMLILTSITLSL